MTAVYFFFDQMSAVYLRVWGDGITDGAW
jgi:hypothetical protein